MRLYITCLFSLFSIVLFGQKVSVIVAGDIMGHGPQIKAAYDSSSDTYNYEPCFQFVKPYLQQADIAIANLEVVLGGKPYTGYPVFSSPDELAVSIKNAGIDVLITANNHCYDKGKYGFERTITFLDSLKIPHLGTYINQNVRDSLHPMILEKNGIRIALLNYTYGTNGIVPEFPNLVNYIDKEKISQEIIKAKEKKADVIIALMHWGAEYILTPNKEQKELANFLVQQGCHAVIGSHPHVVQTFELLYPENDTTQVVPVFYSLGNFISNQRNRYRDGGAMFSFSIEKKLEKFIISDCKYHPYWVYKGVLNNLFQYYIIPLQVYQKDSTKYKFPATDRDSLLQFSQDIKVQLPNLQADTLVIEP